MSVMAELSRACRDDDGATVPWGPVGAPQLCLPEPAMQCTEGGGPPSPPAPPPSWSTRPRVPSPSAGDDCTPDLPNSGLRWGDDVKYNPPISLLLWLSLLFPPLMISECVVGSFWKYSPVLVAAWPDDAACCCCAACWCCSWTGWSCSVAADVPVPNGAASPPLPPAAAAAVADTASSPPAPAPCNNTRAPISECVNRYTRNSTPITRSLPKVRHELLEELCFLKKHNIWWRKSNTCNCLTTFAIWRMTFWVLLQVGNG